MVSPVDETTPKIRVLSDGLGLDSNERSVDIRLRDKEEVRRAHHFRRKGAEAL